MSAPPSPAGSLSSTIVVPYLTLAPLRSEGPAALVPDETSGVVRAVLIQTAQRWHNAFNEVTIRKADDLFACAAQDGPYYDAIAKGAELIEATIDFYFTDRSGPHPVELHPPHTLIVTDPAEAPPVVAFLARRGFLARGGVERGAWSVERRERGVEEGGDGRWQIAKGRTAI